MAYFACMAGLGRGRSASVPHMASGACTHLAGSTGPLSVAQISKPERRWMTARRRAYLLKLGWPGIWSLGAPAPLPLLGWPLIFAVLLTGVVSEEEAAVGFRCSVMSVGRYRWASRLVGAWCLVGLLDFTRLSLLHSARPGSACLAAEHGGVVTSERGSELGRRAPPARGRT